MLTISLNIVVELGFETPTLRFNEARLGTRASQTVRVLGTALGTATLGAVSSDVEGLTARVVEKPASGGGPELEVELTPRKLGTLRGVVRVATSLPTLPSLTLPVYALVKGDITATPAFVAIDAGAPDKTYTVTVTSRRPDLKVKGVTLEPEGHLTARAVADKDGAWKVELGLTPRAREGIENFTTTVRIATNHPDEPVVEVTASRGGSARPNLSRDPNLRRPLPPAVKAAPVPAPKP